jgi:hypothetical protein
MMMRVSLAELAAADIPLHQAEAVAVVVEICRQYSSGRIHGIPSPGVIRLTRDGAIVAEGPITTGAESGVRRAAHLLSDLLPDFDTPGVYRASGGLRLVLARALGTIDLPPYATLEELCDALARFSVEDLGRSVRSLFRAWEEAPARRRPAGPPPALTISDIRRARRATGLSLDELAAVAEVPAARLRELEWGYVRNWKLDDAGRAQVIRYARAAGLDEAVVLSIAWPMIEEAAALRAGSPEAVVALVPSGPQALALVSPSVRGRRSRSRLVSWGRAAAAAASLALATFGLVTWTVNDGHPARVAAIGEPRIATPVAPSAAAPLPAAAPSQPAARRPAAPRHAAPLQVASRQVAPRQAARPARASPRRPGPRNRSFLNKELFRIVIR